jgi:glycosyltransferase involved in cell wall biosynthesis
MIPVTGCVIAYDEERHIAACLDSLSFCREVVVVDSGSRDRTRELAAARGARVIEREWPGHIEQKNFAVGEAATDWVLCLDADERVTPELRARIEALFRDPAALADAYTVNRRNVYLGRWIRGGGFYPDRKVRLFHRGRGAWRGVNPHDRVVLDPPGRIVDLDLDIEHHPYDGIADHLRTVGYFAAIAAREKHSRGQRGVTLHLLANPPWKLFKMLVLQGGLRDGWRGWIVAGLGAFYVFLRYALLWEMIHVRKLAPGTGERVAYGRRGDDALPSGDEDAPA